MGRGKETSHQPKPTKQNEAGEEELAKYANGVTHEIRDTPPDEEIPAEDI